MQDPTQHPQRQRLLPGRGGWLSKVLGALLAVGIIVAAAAVGAFVFGLFLVLAVIASVWLAWQRWRLRRRARANRTGAAAPGQRNAGPRIIQGEYEVVEEYEETRTASSNPDQRRTERHNERHEHH